MAEKVEDEAGRRGGRGDDWGGPRAWWSSQMEVVEIVLDDESNILRLREKEKYTQLSGFSIKRENNLINR